MIPEINRITNLSTQVIVVQEISKKEAKEKIESYFIEHGEADIEELLTNLKIPLRTIIEVIEELKQEGKLVPEDEHKP